MTIYLVPIKVIPPQQDLIVNYWIFGYSISTRLSLSQFNNYVPEIPLEKKYDKGFSFGKSYIRDTLDSEIQKFPSQNLGNRNESIIDNYYFSNNKTEGSVDEDEDEKIILEKRREENILKKRVVKSLDLLWDPQP